MQTSARYRQNPILSQAYATNVNGLQYKAYSSLNSETPCGAMHSQLVASVPLLLIVLVPVVVAVVMVVVVVLLLVVILVCAGF